MQASKRKPHVGGGVQDEHVSKALERIAEEKLSAAQQLQSAHEHIHEDVQKILVKMSDAPNEEQFYLLSKDAIATHQKGWDTLAELEKRIQELKKF